MNITRGILSVSFAILILGCTPKDKPQPGTVDHDSVVYETEALIIKKLSDQVYQHISFLRTESFGRVSCNGMVVINDGEAIVFDTPTDNAGSAELLAYLESQNKKVKGVVATHFHEDCVGGLGEFHTRGIPSYANLRTIQFLQARAGIVIPQNGFENEAELRVGQKSVLLAFPGSGHTADNVVAYFPDEQTLFGGCLVKELGASKGYLGDADTLSWSGTIRNVKMKYPTLRRIIPGHGKPGGSELLDYTEQLFQVATHQEK